MPPQVNTPVVTEVVDTPAPSVIEPVETSNVKVSEVRMWMSRLSHGDDDIETFLRLYEKLNFVEYCVSNGLYDQRLYKLCSMMKRSWFCDNNNTWNLAGVLHRKQHIDLGLMRNKTYLCILHTMTDRFDQAAALKGFNDWETSKYHLKLSEAQIKSIAGETDRASYNKWKEDYEPKEVKEKRDDKEKGKENAFGYSQRAAD
ncbi:hypothetical protein AM587_10001983 [Phytophthora nicotianae]|uniref:Uncharacterized protein n=1 Tax=Phytophthora nicotianae TaxID=4792 RepID=A0A0W8CND0_PHYNI|nr:hypothetical protein AM587_10001983 [Phytophthora nicotianae]